MDPKVELHWPQSSAGSADTRALRANFEILLAASQNDDVGRFLTLALPLLLTACDADSVALASLSGATSSGETWTWLGQAGHTAALPTEHLANSLDAERATVHQGWLLAPLDVHDPHPDILAVHARTALTGDLTATVKAIEPALRQGLETVRARRRQAIRVARLAAILEIVSRWNQTQEMESLLVQMAEAATRLVDADRASIFLWDRATHQLVGRPALGVTGEELRISDKAGIVGQVIATGLPQRQGLADDPQRQPPR